MRVHPDALRPVVEGLGFRAPARTVARLEAERGAPLAALLLEHARGERTRESAALAWGNDSASRFEVFSIRRGGPLIHEIAMTEEFLGDRRERLAEAFAECGRLRLLRERGKSRVTLPHDGPWRSAP